MIADEAARGAVRHVVFFRKRRRRRVGEALIVATIGSSRASTGPLPLLSPLLGNINPSELPVQAKIQA